MRAFIVRPFGVKAGIDFDRVERELILPALDDLGIRGGTTGEIARAGNIRLDLFEQLLLADLVIADISIHNANVYYELGVRHALRAHRTLLIRARLQEVPFDLKTDRYLEYDSGNPASARDALREAVRQTAASGASDSPVYLLLPDLKPRDPSAFRPVPPNFREAVARAERTDDAALLGLLGDEIDGLDWEIQGRRLVGRAQFQMRRWRAARDTWERIRAIRAEDPEANLALATVYQRLGDLAASTAAIERVADDDITVRERAEARSLAGSNLKAQWVAQWHSLPTAERPRAALRSAFLHEALTAYHEAFLEDLDHYYSGLNALALHTVVLELARAEPGPWQGRFASRASAESALEDLREKRGRLVGAVFTSLRAARHRAEREGSPDVWLDLSVADFELLTSENPEFVASRYEEARAREAARQATDPRHVAGAFTAEASARQIRLYLDLGILVENCRAGLRALGATESASAAPAPPAGRSRPRILVFTGHRLDAPGRAQPRFPAGKEAEAHAAILAAVTSEISLAAGAAVTGVAGGASGGDILFHEVCAQLGLPTTLLLALPRDAFAARSVRDGGPGWMERYRRLCDLLPTRVLGETEALPDWLRGRGDYDVWKRNNLWTLHHALAHEEADRTLIALWNGQGDDGPGGTQDMIRIAGERGMNTVILDTRRLFGLP